MGSKQKVVEATARLLRRQGLSATGLNRIIRESRAPRGSIYFHFPGGKEELTIAALRAAHAAVVERMQQAAASRRSFASALRAVVASYARELRGSGYRSGCPIANVTLDVASGAPGIRRVCAEIFVDWTRRIAQALERDGVPRKDAPALAEFILSSFEGALIVSRARRSTAPLTRVANQIEAVLAASRKA